MPLLSVEQAHKAATFIKAKPPGTDGPKSWPMISSQWQVHQKCRSWSGGDGGKASRRKMLSLLPILILCCSFFAIFP